MTSEAYKLEKELIKNPPPSAADIEAAELLVKEKGEDVAQLKSDKARKEDILAAVAELKIAKEKLAKLEERSKLNLYRLWPITRSMMTVRQWPATDVVVPKVGELIGGSQREEHYEVIQQRGRCCFCTYMCLCIWQCSLTTGIVTHRSLVK
ncbi:hypothetical protein SO802_030680 [Lithocarpus litseifolius]|uniref:WHEP-TRS domain-containing protein n=1 Tax=Lithocarpus litseifolius TaxID=425828 RepID=A0AAW2BLP2_9ROSI